MSSENLLAFLTRLHHHAHRRPWTELIDRSAISWPESLAEAFSRLRKNVLHFRVNYLIVLAAVLAASLLSRPLSLLLIASLAGAWLFLYILRPPEQQLVVFHRAFTNREVLIGLILATVAVVLLTNVVSVVVTAVMVGLGMVCVHGALRVPEDLFLEQQEPWPLNFGGFPFGENGPTSLVGVSLGPLSV